MAAAAMSARTALQVVIGWDTAEIKGLIDKFVDALLQLVHFLLRIDKRLGNRIAEQGLLLGLKGGDFPGIEGLALVLFLVQNAAAFAQALVKVLSLGIRHERIHPLADALELRLLYNGFAKIHRLLPHNFIDLR
jgi:hypothetical protein